MKVALLLGHSLPFQGIALLNDLSVEGGGHIDGGHQEKNQNDAAVGQCFLKNGFHIVRFFILKFEGAKVRKITVIANDKKQVVFYSLLFFSNRKVQHFILFSSGQLKKVYFCRRGTIKHTFKKNGYCSHH